MKYDELLRGRRRGQSRPADKDAECNKYIFAGKKGARGGNDQGGGGGGRKPNNHKKV